MFAPDSLDWTLRSGIKLRIAYQHTFLLFGNLTVARTIRRPGVYGLIGITLDST